MPHRSETDLKQLEASLDKLNTGSDKQFILCGDFNCPHIDWPTSAISNSSTGTDRDIHQQLIDISNKFGLTQIIQDETREKNILDLTFVTNPTLVVNSSIVPGISDHDITITDFSIRPHYQKPKTRKIYTFSKADWTKLKNDCLSLAEVIKAKYDNGCETNELWALFKTHLLQHTDKHVPSKTVSNKNRPPWLNNLLKRKLKKKARLFNQAKKTGNYSNFRFAQKECRRAFKKAESDYVNTKILDGLENNNIKPFWSYVKAKKQDNVGVAPILENGSLLVQSVEKAESFLRQFVSVFTPVTDDNLPNVTNRCNNSLQTITVTEIGVQKLLENVNVNKAIGPDKIPNHVLKECATELAPAITCIFQSSLDSGTLPDDWTNANVSPIFKKGDRHRAENYRPVSLTSVTSKLLEHIVCKAAMQHLETNKILTSKNHGFRSGFSCETQLLATMDDLASSYDKGNQIDVAILDFSKAFDTVPHRKLLHKLDNYGIRGPLHKWVESFLTKRHMRVMVDGEVSQEAEVTSGVPQGTVLGPLLFLCHINDLPEAVSSSVRLFADDCLLYRIIKSISDHVKLQEDLKALEKWAHENGMAFNAKKCYILSIGQKTSFFYQLDNTILQEVSANPYLGVMISNDLKWDTHINNISSKASSTLGFVRRNIQNCPVQTRRAAYLALVRSSLEYASAVWDPYIQQDIDKLERVQRRAARFISKDFRSKQKGCVTKMLQTHNLPTLQQRRQDIRLTMFFKIANGTLPGLPPADYLTKVVDKRLRRATRFDGFVSQNPVDNYERKHSRSYITPSATGVVYKNSFFVKTTTEWNSLEEEQVNCPSVDSFKNSLHRRMI